MRKLIYRDKYNSSRLSTSIFPDDSQALEFLRDFRKSKTITARRRTAPPHDAARPRFHHRGEIQEGFARVRAAETRGIVPGEEAEDLAARSAVCTRVMICGRPDRDPVRLVGWQSGE